MRHQEPLGPRLRTMAEPESTAAELTDGDLQSEIELVGELVVAATSSSGPLPQERIDQLLGIEPDEAAEDVAP